MAESDSGVDTGSESNESNSMSIGSPPRSDEDKDAIDIIEKTLTYPHASASLGRNLGIVTPNFGFQDYARMEFIGKLKRRKAICSCKHEAIPKLKHIIGERKLRAASNSNAVETVRSLLDLDVNPCASDSRQRTALHFAAAGGHTEVAQLLLERGADPNQRDSVGNTPLHLAACTTHIEMVTLLLKAGTDINALDYSGRSPFHLAQSKLKLLQMNKEYSSAQLKTEIIHVLEMMQVYLQRSGRCGEDLINAFSNRLHHHQTREEVDNDVSDLLCSLSHLSLQAS